MGHAYDVVCAFEVLEHMPGRCGRAADLGPGTCDRGGHVVVSVPEGPERFGPSDVQVGHQRRYTQESLAELLRSAGLEVEQVRLYGWPLGYALEAVSNRAAVRAGASESSGSARGPDGRFRAVAPARSPRRGGSCAWVCGRSRPRPASRRNAASG